MIFISARRLLNYLVENNKVVSDDSALAEILGKYFGNIVQNLGINGLTNTSSDNKL